VKPIDPELLSWLPHWRRWGLAVTALAGLRAAVVVAQAVLLADVLVRAFAGESLGRPFVALLVVVVLRAGVHGLADWTGRSASARLRTSLRSRITRHAVDLGPAWLGGAGGRGLTTLVSEGVDGLDGYVSSFLPQLVQTCVVPAAVLAAVGVADWRSLLVLVITLPLLPLFLALVGMHTRKETEAEYAGLARLTDHFLDVVVGLPTLTVFGRAARQATVLRDLARSHRERTMRVLRTAFLSALVLELLATLSVAVVAVFLGFRLVDGHVGFRTALTVLLLAPEAFAPVRAVGSSFHAAASGLAAAEAARAVLHTPLPHSPLGRSVPSPGALVLEDVTAHYPDGTVGIEDVSLEVLAGECVAVVGDSGCGKSTLLQVLLGLVPASRGRVLVGGVDLADCDLDAWREQVAWVPQRPWLFAGTLEDNIRLGRPDASSDALARAVRDAHVGEFVAHLPSGLATEVGERGLGLSLGQQRRVALARALLRDAAVLLLDEPTADLDLRSELEVVRALRSVTPGRTVVVTTHRAAPFAGWTRTVRLDRPAAERSA
jgi:ATP-binding cassette subfamily C protein CydCD